MPATCFSMLPMASSAHNHMYDILLKCFRWIIVPKWAPLVFVKIVESIEKRVMIALSKHTLVIHTFIFPSPDQAGRLLRPRQSKYFICAMFKRVDNLEICSIAHIPRAQLFSHVQHTTIIQAILCIWRLNLLSLCKEGNWVSKNLGYSSPEIWPQ